MDSWYWKLDIWGFIDLRTFLAFKTKLQNLKKMFMELGINLMPYFLIFCIRNEDLRQDFLQGDEHDLHLKWPDS
jgi:hypothetical protein